MEDAYLNYNFTPNEFFTPAVTDFFFFFAEV